MTTEKEREWVFFTAKKEVTDCMSFPIEFKNLSITFFQKSWHETWHAILIICSGSATKCMLLVNDRATVQHHGHTETPVEHKKMNPCVDEWQPDLRSDTRQNGVPHAIEMQTKFP